MAEEGEGKGFETIGGVTIAVFAAVLAITDLGGGKYGDDELIAHNEKANAYEWYQSKSIKQTLTDGQAETLDMLIKSGAIIPEQQSAMKEELDHLHDQSQKYSREKKEILLGSAVVGKENWVQDVDGELGKVVGAKEWEANADKLGGAGDWFDLATLFLQISLVLGAIALVVQRPGLKWAFYGTMCVLGLIGSVLSGFAFKAAM